MFDFKDERYNRQENMPEWGTERQALLSNAKVAVIGAGGVKSTLLMSLAAGGIGYIRIIEFDKVELSNLNRQILYRTSDIGVLKGEAAIRTLRDLNTDIIIELITAKVNSDNINDLLNGVDLIVEGGDSPAARNLVNKYCLKNNKPMVHSSAQFSYGYVFSVIPDLRTACFACVFPNDYIREQTMGSVPVNVLSTSIAGSLGAAEVFKWFMGYKDTMVVNKKRCFHSLILSGDFEDELCSRNLDCPVCAKYYV